MGGYEPKKGEYKPGSLKGSHKRTKLSTEELKQQGERQRQEKMEGLFRMFSGVGNGASDATGNTHTNNNSFTLRFCRDGKQGDDGYSGNKGVRVSDFLIKSDDERTLFDYYVTEDVKNRCRRGYSIVVKNSIQSKKKELIIAHRSNDGEEHMRIAITDLSKYKASDLRDLLPSNLNGPIRVNLHAEVHDTWHAPGSQSDDSVM